MSKLFTVAIYLPDKVNLYHYAIVSSLLNTKFEGHTLFKLLRFSNSNPVVTTDPDVQIKAQSDWTDIHTADALVIPSWTNLDAPPSSKLQDLIKSFNKENKWLIGACFGAYALAYSGVLNGKNCCTHWSAEEDFSKKFPYCSLKKNVIYVQDDNILTSAGASATVDCILHFVRIIYSVAVANRLAKILAIPLIREGAQDQFLDYAKPKIVNALPALIKYMEQKPPTDLTVDVMMQKSFLSRRSFTRKFKALTGTTFEVWYRKIRLRTACELLETTELPIEIVAERSGYKSPISFRQQFKQQFRSTPSDWRKNKRRQLPEPDSHQPDMQNGAATPS